MPRGKISKRQQEIYDYIKSYTEEHAYPPSVREIGTAVGLASPSTVHMHLKQLEEQGFGNLPICMAKTQYSFTDDAHKLGAPEGFRITVRNLKASAGAGSSWRSRATS